MNQYYPHLLSPLRIGNVVLKNHLIAGPSKPHFIMGPENYPGPGLIKHYANKAKAGAALVIANGAVDLEYERGIPSYKFDVYDKQGQSYLGQLTEAVHFYGSKVAFHALFNAPDGYDCSAGILSHKTVGDDSVAVEGKEMPEEMIEELIQGYVRYAKALQSQAIDGLMIHMAYQHSTLSRFLSPLTNHRTDKWGGSYENRTRLAYRIFDEIREAVGPDFLLEASISFADPEPGGWTMEDTIRFAQDMEGRLDLLQVRAEEIDPCHPTGFDPRPMPFQEYAAQVKAANPKCLIEGIAGYFDPDLSEAALAEGKVDVITMARGFISNPNYVQLVSDGRKEDLVPCIRCNKCHVPYFGAPQMSVCSVNPIWGMEHIYPDLPTKPDRIKKVAVIGGGPGGMKAALTCAERGHNVTLYEKTDSLGGELKYTDLPDFKWPVKKFKDYLIRQINKSKVKVLLNTEVTREMLDKEYYDTVLCAIGGHPVFADIPGIHSDQVVTPQYAYFHEKKLANEVVVIGSGESGVECGLYLAKQGHKVTVLCRRDMLAPTAFRVHFYTLFMDALEKEPNFNYLLKVHTTSVEKDRVIYHDENGVEHAITCGSVVAATGHKPNLDEAMELSTAGSEFYMIGDVKQVGSIQTTMRSAWTIANTI